MEFQFRPIEQWPGLRTPAERRRAYTFKASYSQTLELLYRELQHLSARNVVVQLEVSESQIRQDGHMRSDAKVQGPGVVLYLQSEHGALTYPCDRFSHWHHNLRAIALALEHLRAVDRYGITSRGEQYRGWLRLPCLFDPAEFVAQGTAFGAEKVRTDPDARELAFKQRAKMLHPDVGGSSEEMTKLNEAMELLRGAE